MEDIKFVTAILTELDETRSMAKMALPDKQYR